MLFNKYLCLLNTHMKELGTCLFQKLKLYVFCRHELTNHALKRNKMQRQTHTLDFKDFDT